jgi:hypothetical protein
LVYCVLRFAERRIAGAVDTHCWHYITIVVAKSVPNAKTLFFCCEE